MKEWILSYNDWNPEEQPLREALCTLGNGLFATRGAAEEVPENGYNYPGTYMAGGYNRLTSEVSGKNIENEDLVNWPNWLFLTFRHRDEEDWLDLSAVEVLEYLQELDMKQGVLQRKMKFRDQKDRVTSLISRRVFSMGNAHEAAIEWNLIPENWSGHIIIRSGIDGRVSNHGVERYRELEGRHIRVEDKGRTDEDHYYLSARSVQSEIKVSMACRTRMFRREEPFVCKREEVPLEDFAGEDIAVACEKMLPIRVEKTVAIFSSRDFAISDPLNEALKQLKHSREFRLIKERSVQAWTEIWERSDIRIEDENGHENQGIVHLHLFHLYQTVSVNSMGYDIGVPSRGWHGEAYRGHIFWDELYIFPLLNLHDPQLARSLLMYRYRRLHRAREAARGAGFRGSMFPWQSGSNGREESQVIHLNPHSGRWIPDNTHLQRHISSAVAYNVWQYYQSTNDIEFLLTYGAEMILNVALFWASVAELNPRTDRYEIRGVVGPDEFHTAYPTSESPGLNNNAYTNFMAAWVLGTALEIIEMVEEDTLRKLEVRVGFKKEEARHWEDVASRLHIPFNEKGIIMQFEGFEDLEELDWEKYHEKYGTNLRLDRILEGEGDSVNRYRASKQADVLMLFYLFSSEELMDIFGRLGYDFKAEQIVDNIQYYQAIASHGSTLSRVVHSWVYARSDRSRSWDQFTKALRADIEDVQGGTTSEGIHLGAMAGSVDLLLRGYSGMVIREDVLWFNPRLPKQITGIFFRLRYRSHWIRVHLTHQKITIDFDKGWANPVEIGIQDEKHTFKRDDHREFEL